MARTKQTARKSTGGRAPRRQLATFRGEGAAARSKEERLNLSDYPTFKPSELESHASSGPVLGLAFSKEVADSCNDLSNLPVFDLDDESLVQECLPGFTVCRKPSLLVGNKGTMSQAEKHFLDQVMTSARKKFPSSSYVVVLADPEDPENTRKVQHVAEEHVEQGWWKQFRAFNLLPKMLETGKLHGCELRGNKETGQFGLVATKNLKACTPVAVECGLIWSRRKHQEMIDERQDPMLGLASNDIPINLFLSFVPKKTWKTCTKSCRKERLKSTQGFVVDSCIHGNETKHIDDAAWLHAGHGSIVTPPNIEAFLVLDLKRGLPTVGFFVKEEAHVKKHHELTMDWGCWREISSSLLPGQAILSIEAHKERETLISICREKNIKAPSIEGLQAELEEIDPVFFKSKDVLERVSSEDRISYGEKYNLLYNLVFPSDAAVKDCSALRRAKKKKPTWYKSLPPGEIDYKSPASCIAVRPEGDKSEFLTDEARKHLDMVKESTVDMAVEPLFGGEELSRRVEVVEIIDIRNPACLFCLPGEKAYGVIAKRDFKKDEPILLYGGLLMDNEKGFGEFDPYVFNLDLEYSEMGYEGPSLFIWGKNSVGGKLNDSLSIGGTVEREANLSVWLHFDSVSHNPQLVLYASRDVAEGEELLYSYGLEYWKVMWKALMMSHAVDAAKMLLHSSKIKAAIQGGTAKQGATPKQWATHKVATPKKGPVPKKVVMPDVSCSGHCSSATDLEKDPKRDPQSS